MNARRRVAVGLGMLLLLVLGVAPGVAAASGVSQAEAVKLLDETRRSVDETLRMIENGQADEALAIARDGYLTHFELVEIPLRIADNKLTIEAEAQFAIIRQDIKDNAPIDRIRDEIVALRNLLDQAERSLTEAGVGAPALVTSQAFLILFREGFEIILLLSVLIGYLEAARSPQLIRPILGGVALAAAATVLTVVMMPTLLSLLPVGREVLEAVIALIAVAVLFLAIAVRVFVKLLDEDEPFVVLASAGLVTQLTVQAFINIAVNVGLAPSKGMTLPFISYGGSSMIALCLGFGLLLAFTRRNPYLKRSPYVVRWNTR